MDGVEVAESEDGWRHDPDRELLGVLYRPREKVAVLVVRLGPPPVPATPADR
jgi:hypothetical protein